MLRSFGIVAVAAVAGLFGFAQYVRRSSMFLPDRYPTGNWDTSALPMQPVEHRIRTRDGISLHGWLFRANDTGAPMMIWCHGNAGNITERAATAAKLAQHGVSVLLFDWRGYGKSEGKPTERGLLLDALAVYDYAKTLGARSIVPYGESLGGPFAAYMAKHRTASCVVIENSFPSLRELGNTLYAPLPIGWTAPFALTTARWLNEAGVPVLVMHGKADDVIPFSLGMSLYDSLNVPKEILVSDTAHHCEIATCEALRYFQIVPRFIKTAGKPALS